MANSEQVRAAFAELESLLAAEMVDVERQCLASLETQDLANLERTRRLTDHLAGVLEGVRALNRGWKVAQANLGEHRRRYFGRIAAGHLTPRATWREVILRALVALGDSASADAVLARVEELLGDRLTGADRQAVPSRPTVARWRNACHGERHLMVREGLLDSAAPRGEWRLTPAGRTAALRAEAAAAGSAD